MSVYRPLPSTTSSIPPSPPSIVTLSFKPTPSPSVVVETLVYVPSSHPAPPLKLTIPSVLPDSQFLIKLYTTPTKFYTRTVNLTS